jgi:phosphoglycolate phosphatase-like HAD superfamily hydrolase
MNVSTDATWLILFDIDGTLMLSGGAGREVTQRAMMDVFGTSSRVDTHHFGGKTDWQTLIELLEEHHYDEARIGEAMHHYEEAMTRHMSDLIGKYPARACTGALDLVQRLRQRPDVLLGVVTGNVSQVAPIKLRAVGFDPDWFPVGAFGNEAANRDHLPPLALERAIRHYGRHITPEQVIIVGDTETDVACARALGAVAVGVLTGFTTREALEAARPDYLLDDLCSFEQAVLSDLAEKRLI